MTANNGPQSLAELRAEIDRIDEAMHRLLIERSDIIGRLIRAKRTADQGSAALEPPLRNIVTGISRSTSADRSEILADRMASHDTAAHRSRHEMNAGHARLG